LQALDQLRKRKKKIIILSNSGKRAINNIDRMTDLGITPDLYDEIVTSGELTRNGLKKQDDSIFKGLGQKCFLISRGGDKSIVDGLDIELVDDIKNATFLLISGSDAPEKTMERDYDPILREGARMRLKAICANPDSDALLGDNYVMGPGLIAKRFQEFGGVVEYIGKPHKPIFDYCLRKMQSWDIFPGQIVMVGDTMAHDILGAHNAEIDSLLVKCGIHAKSFLNIHEPVEINKALNVLCALHNNVKPTYLAPSFRWGNPLPDRKHKNKEF
jgi:HAD superfamily hydrolase (TIGR01459 family)